MTLGAGNVLTSFGIDLDAFGIEKASLIKF
jgi:hypothetical protein